MSHGSGSLRCALQSVTEAKRLAGRTVADAACIGAGNAEELAEKLGKVDACLDVAMEAYAETGAALTELHKRLEVLGLRLKVGMLRAGMKRPEIGKLVDGPVIELLQSIDKILK